MREEMMVLEMSYERLMVFRPKGILPNSFFLSSAKQGVEGEVKSSILCEYIAKK
jgi:hypothetical protein